ncbi:MAG: sigma-70 family RNA polymerase sigma factor [Thermoanaerobaculia bacterium]
MTAIPLCDLFRRCLTRRGSEEWREFVHRCGRGVRKAVWWAFRRRGVELAADELDELVQDLYCRLLNIRRFRGRSELELWAYLHRAAHSLAIDHRRAARAGKRRIKLVSATAPDAPYEHFVSPDASPEQRCLESERWRVFLARCATLAPRNRKATLRALRMALFEGWSSREIASRLDGALTAAQIDSLICRLTRRLIDEGLQVPRRGGGWWPPAASDDPRAGDPRAGDEAAGAGLRGR